MPKVPDGYNGENGYMVRATPCTKHFSSYSGPKRTKKVNIKINPKSYLSFEWAVSKTMDFEFVRRNRHRLIMVTIEKMSRAAMDI